MRVLFLTLYPEPAASPRYRVTQFVPELEFQGFECTVQSALTEEEYRASLKGKLSSAKYHWLEMRRRRAQIKAAKKYDIVVLQKAISTAYIKGFGKKLRSKAKRLIVDIDDAVHLHPPVTLSSPWHHLEDQQQLQKIIQSADLTLAGNQWLVDELTTLGGEAKYWPTVVDCDHYSPAPQPDDTFRLGWIGNPSTAKQLKDIAPILDDLNDAEVSIVGANPGSVAIENAFYHPWIPEKELADLHSFSVGLMPLAPTEWSRGKCALKALLYMACGIPCIATPYGAVNDIIEHNVNGLLADTPEEWAASIEQLRDPEERKRLGTAARKTVEQNFSLKVQIPLYADLLRATI